MDAGALLHPALSAKAPALAAPAGRASGLRAHEELSDAKAAGRGVEGGDQARPGQTKVGTGEGHEGCRVRQLAPDRWPEPLATAVGLRDEDVNAGEDGQQLAAEQQDVGPVPDEALELLACQEGVPEHVARGQAQTPEALCRGGDAARLAVDLEADELALGGRRRQVVSGEARVPQGLLHMICLPLHDCLAGPQRGEVVDVQERGRAPALHAGSHGLVREPRARAEDALPQPMKMSQLHQRHGPGPAHGHHAHAELGHVPHAVRQLLPEPARQPRGRHGRQPEEVPHLEGHQVLVLSVLNVALGREQDLIGLELDVAEVLAAAQGDRVWTSEAGVDPARVEDDPEGAVFLVDKEDADVR